MAFQFFLPIYMTFNKPFDEIVTPLPAYFMYIMLLLDIIINMHTSYYEKGKQITDRKSVILRYFNTSFILDILPILPISIDLFIIRITNDYLKYIFLIFMVKLNRLYSILGKI